MLRGTRKPYFMNYVFKKPLSLFLRLLCFTSEFTTFSRKYVHYKRMLANAPTWTLLILTEIATFKNI